MKTLGRSCQNCFQHVAKTVMTIFLFKKYLYFNFCLTFSGKTFDILKNVVVVETATYMSRCETCWKFFPLKRFSYTCFRLSIRKSSEIRRAWLSKLHSVCLEDFSGGNFFWYKNNSVTLFVLWQIFCQTFDIIFLAVFSHYPPRCPEELIKDRVQGFFLGSDIFLSFEQNYHLDFVLKIRSWFSTLLSKFIEERFGDNFFQETNNLWFLFGNWPHSFPNFIDKLWAWLTKLHFAFFMKTLWNERFSWKDIFSLMLHDFGQIISIMCVKTLGPNCQNCFQRVGKSLLKSFLQEVPVF